MLKRKTSLEQFSTGVIAALVLLERDILSTRQTRTLHHAVIKAFEYVCQKRDPRSMRFTMCFVGVQSQSDDVNLMVAYWVLRGWATLDGTLLRLTLPQQVAKRWLWLVPGGIKQYIPATQVLLNNLHEISTNLE